MYTFYNSYVFHNYMKLTYTNTGGERDSLEDLLNVLLNDNENSSPTEESVERKRGKIVIYVSFPSCLISQGLSQLHIAMSKQNMKNLFHVIYYKKNKVIGKHILKHVYVHI